MTINSLRLANYKQYRHLNLEFKEGLVGIIGKNGAGKSTIFEAILYCLFGRDEGNKALVRSASADAKEAVSLELSFSMGSARYLVRREFRGKALTVGAEFYKNDSMVAKGVSAVNEELAKVLNMERDAFKRSVFSGQKELSELSDSSGEARKKMVRRMLGLDKLDEVQQAVNADLRDLSSQAAGQRQSLLSEEVVGQLVKEMAERELLLKEKRAESVEQARGLKDLQAQLLTEKEKFEQEEKRLQQHNALAQALVKASERLSVLQRQSEGLAQKLAEIKGLQALLDAQRGQWQAFEQEKKAFEGMDAEHKRHVNRLARLDKIEESRGLLAAIEANIAELRQRLTEKHNLETELQAKNAEITALEAEIEGKRGELRGLDKEIGGIQASVRERSEKLESLRQLGRSGSCPTCLQPLLEGYERAVSALEAQLGQMQGQQMRQLEEKRDAVVQLGKQLKEKQAAARAEAEQLLQARARLTELARALDAEEKQKTAIEARIAADEAILREIGDVHFDEAAYQRLKASLAEKERAYRDFLAQENYVSKEKPATQGSLEATEKELGHTAQAIEGHRAGISQLGFEESRYQAAKQAFSAQNERYQAQAEMLRATERSVMELESEQEKAASTLRAQERIASQISDKLEEIELLRRLAEMLGQFKTEILEKVSPGISREASELFNRITKGKYEGIRVDENFDFFIADGGLFYPIERFSGGEVDLANFCLRIAITKAIMDLSGASAENRMEFLAFDEIFGSQDEERRFEMMLALNYLQEQFRQIYIVSHIESLKDFFPHLLEVQLGADGSTAVWR
jgi:exonuclease SbcC